MNSYSILIHLLIVRGFECFRSNFFCRSNTKHGARKTWPQRPVRTGVEFHDDHVVFVRWISWGPQKVCNVAHKMHAKKFCASLFLKIAMEYCLYFVNIDIKIVDILIVLEEHIISYDCCEAKINVILIRSVQLAECSNYICNASDHLQKKMRKMSRRGSLSAKYTELGHFMSLFYRGRLKAGFH